MNSMMTEMGVHEQHDASDLKPLQHVIAIISKAAAQLHFLKQLKRLSAGLDDLLYFFGAMIRPVLKYAAQCGTQVLLPCR